MSGSTSRALDEVTLLALWEWGRERHDVDRAVAVVAAATGLPWATTAALPLGARDGHLLDVHRKSFGARLVAIARCPACDERLELAVECDAIRLPDPPPGPHRVDASRELTIELPDSVALAAVADLPLDAAREALLRGCVRAPTDPTPDELEAVAAAISAIDPQSDIRFALECAACGHPWTSTFPIDRFVWARIDEHAERLLRDVQRLAAHFHWSESEILAMSPLRRRAYLELCTDAA